MFQRNENLNKPRLRALRTHVTEIKVLVLRSSIQQKFCVRRHFKTKRGKGQWQTHTRILAYYPIIIPLDVFVPGFLQTQHSVSSLQLFFDLKHVFFNFFRYNRFRYFDKLNFALGVCLGFSADILCLWKQPPQGKIQFI